MSGRSEISMNGQQLEEVMAFNYLGAKLTKDGRSTAEIKIRLAIATASRAKLNKIWSSKDVSFSTKIKLYKTLVLSTLLQTCHSIELKNLDLTNKKSGSGGKNRDHGPIGYKKK